MNASPRSGVSQLFSERPPDDFLLHARCVSPTVEDWDVYATSKALHIRHTETLMDLTKLEESGDVSHGDFPTKDPSLFQFESRDGQAGLHQARSVVTGTRQKDSLCEILWGGASRAVQSNHFLKKPDGALSTVPINASDIDPNAFLDSNGTMTSHALHHNENKLFHLGTQALESRVVQPRMSSSTRRHRSRAIAIKQRTTSNSTASSRDEKPPHEIRESTAAAEYDWATWRMYNRIIDYRQKFPVTYHHEEASSDESSMPRSTLNLRLSATAMEASESSSTASLSSSYQGQDYTEYGEVFDLDM